MPAAATAFFISYLQNQPDAAAAACVFQQLLLRVADAVIDSVPLFYLTRLLADTVAALPALPAAPAADQYPNTTTATAAAVDGGGDNVDAVFKAAGVLISHSSNAADFDIRAAVQVHTTAHS